MSDRSPPGLFVTFEGIDGAGKSSHLASAQAFFESRGRTVLMTREPGGTPLAEALRGLVLHEPMDPLTEALLIFAARRDHVDRRIRPALARGEVVVCDRFSDSTFAYQGAGRGFDLEVLSALERWVQEDLQPDITLWFDLPPSLAAARLRDGRTPDRFESEQQAFFERVRAGYADRARVFPLRFRRIDAEGSRDELRQRVDAALARALDSTATEARLPAGRPTPEK